MTPADRSAPLHPRPVRVLETRAEMPGCTTLRVAPADPADAADPAGACGFAPGQFYMVYVFGLGEVPISVSGDAARPGELTFTVMAVGAVTRALCAVRPGQTLGLRGPFGTAWPVEALTGRDVIVMAGGLGLAPLRPAIYHLLRHRDRYGAVALLYGTRQPRSIVFAPDLTGWREAAAIDVAVTVDSGDRDWSGHVGVVTELLKGRRLDPARTAALLCGPEIMMRFSAYALRDRGVAAGAIHVSMERNMKCGVRMCGRCQYGPFFVCDDGPVFSFDRVEHLFGIREV
ncbi:FAD/NAD(P)-binding protein [Roseospira goensis]|uniref:NAD(P)H-flavin reductase n=1 Tax=Roseospira goensis TaxID=391922 RepID=A0A7W6RWM2_9PROT|nr:FAD/NAD(P)-binding protein [Roseospira goensis]MBB4284588.1 NAD(P)H-flavin reductase [Roseospira goensis]